MTEELRREFEQRKPWVTKFVIDGQAYGGQYDAAHDPRVQWLREHFPHASSILELGSLEGGHSFTMASWPHVERVVAVEGRKPNLKRALFIQSLLNEDKVQFMHANLETLNLAELGNFDAVLCLGLLYHLPKPWLLLEKLSQVSCGLLLWTHYCEEDRGKVKRGGYRGRLYREWLFAFEALSGLSPASFWPVKKDLFAMLSVAGFKRVDILEDVPDHEHGPAITLAAHQD